MYVFILNLNSTEQATDILSKQPHESVMRKLVFLQLFQANLEFCLGLAAKHAGKELVFQNKILQKILYTQLSRLLRM